MKKKYLAIMLISILIIGILWYVGEENQKRWDQEEFARLSGIAGTTGKIDSYNMENNGSPCTILTIIFRNLTIGQDYLIWFVPFQAEKTDYILDYPLMFDSGSSFLLLSDQDHYLTIKIVLAGYNKFTKESIFLDEIVVVWHIHENGYGQFIFVPIFVIGIMILIIGIFTRRKKKI